MGLAQVGVDAVAGACALADQGRPGTGLNCDPHPGGVGDAPAGLLVPANQSLSLGNAPDGNGLPLPAIETKDAVGFRDYLPTLQVVNLRSALLPLADVGPIQRSGQGCPVSIRLMCGVNLVDR